MKGPHRFQQSMVDVAVVGAGQTKYGNHPLGLKGMWAEAASKAFASIDGDFDPQSIDEAFIGSIAFGGAQLGNTAALLTEHSGMEGISRSARGKRMCFLWLCASGCLDGHKKAVKRILLWPVALRK